MSVRRSAKWRSLIRKTNEQPVVDIVITTIDVFEDTENAVIMLKAVGDETVTTTVTVTVTDSTGMSTQQTFDATVAPDNDDSVSEGNSQPYLLPIDVPDQIFHNQTIEIQLNSFDVEGDPVEYFAGFLSTDISDQINQETGVLTLTGPAQGTGATDISVVVTSGPGSGINFDRQAFSINVLEPPLYHDLDAPADVDGQDGLSALDALLIINVMADNGGVIDLTNGEVDGLNTEFSYNVNGDMQISALDALLVVNALAAADDSEQLDSEQLAAPSAQSETLFLLVANQTPAIAFDDDDEEDLISLLAQHQLGLPATA